MELVLHMGDVLTHESRIGTSVSLRPEETNVTEPFGPAVAGPGSTTLKGGKRHKPLVRWLWVGCEEPNPSANCRGTQFAFASLGELTVPRQRRRNWSLHMGLESPDTKEPRIVNIRLIVLQQVQRRHTRQYLSLIKLTKSICR
jgi:hypothetical protein